MMFRDEAERQRAREAMRIVLGNLYVPGEMTALDALWDAEFPPMPTAPEPYLPGMLGDDGIDPDVRTARTPTPSPAFAAALARYTETLHALYAPSRLTGYFDTAASYTAARAEVLRVHQEEVERAK